LPITAYLLAAEEFERPVEVRHRFLGFLHAEQCLADEAFHLTLVERFWLPVVKIGHASLERVLVLPGSKEGFVRSAF